MIMEDTNYIIAKSGYHEDGLFFRDKCMNMVIIVNLISFRLLDTKYATAFC